MQNILRFLEINQHNTIKIKYLLPFFYGVHNSPNELTIHLNEFVIALKGKVYQARWGNMRTKLQDLSFIPSSESNIVIIKWKSLIFSNLSITYADESTYLRSDWYEQFLNEDSSENLSMNVIINKSNVIEIFINISKL